MWQPRPVVGEAEQIEVYLAYFHHHVRLTMLEVLMSVVRIDFDRPSIAFLDYYNHGWVGHRPL